MAYDDLWLVEREMWGDRVSWSGSDWEWEYRQLLHRRPRPFYRKRPLRMRGK